MPGTAVTIKHENFRNKFKDLINFIYPDLCASCENPLNTNEKYICINCQGGLPFTNFHDLPENPVEKIFWGRFPFEAATSFLKFQKGGHVQQLLHNIKYRNQKEAAIKIGNWFGSQLHISKRFQFIDSIIPVPLHPDRVKVRGYNQSELLGKGMSESMQIPLFTDVLHRTSYTETQTNKSRYKRWENVSKIFNIDQSEKIYNKHILLIDDVVTSGSTLEACASHLLDTIKNCRISLATIAVSV